MRKSRDSLDTILHEREEGVGAESPVGDLSRDGVKPETEFPFKDLSGRSVLQNKPFYGLKIALVSATRNAQAGEVMAVDEVKSGIPVGERDGDPEGYSSLDEQQLDAASERHELSKKADSEPEFVTHGENVSANVKDRMCDNSVSVESNSEVQCESDLNASMSQVEKTVLSVESSVSSIDDETEATDAQSMSLPDKEQEQTVEVFPESNHGTEISDKEICSTTGLTSEQLTAGERDSLTTVLDKDSVLGHICEAATQESAHITDPLEQRSTNDSANPTDLHVVENTSRIADNYETGNACMKQENMASETSTEQQNENSIVSESTPDKEGTQTATNDGESDSSLTPSTLGEEGQESKVIPSCSRESPSLLTEDSTNVKPSSSHDGNESLQRDEVTKLAPV